MINLMTGKSNCEEGVSLSDLISILFRNVNEEGVA